MAYKKLSEQVLELSNPQRSDTFVKLFKAAVRDGTFEAAYIPERFTLPKSYAARDGSSYSRDGRDMIFDATPAFMRWFEQANKDLAAARKGGRIKVSAETIQSGLVDFKALAADTRQKLHASYSKGQQLGSRRKPAAKPRKK